jgi:2-iminoacetate synthase
VLYGLGDPVIETVALVAHARYLTRETGRPPASVSVPRLEPAEDVPFTLDPPHPVPDRLWLRIVALLRLALPSTHVIVSTRERQLRRPRPRKPMPFRA